MTAAQIRQSCRFCHGAGCLNCDALCDQEYKRQFPRGLEPLATFDRTDPEDMALLREVFANNTLDTIMGQLAKVALAQEILETASREDIP